MTAPAQPLRRFFIPAIAAQAVKVAELASPMPISRLSYRFIIRVLRDGPVYGCRITASKGVADALLGRFTALAGEAQSHGDTTLLVGCALAIEAIVEAH